MSEQATLNFDAIVERDLGIARVQAKTERDTPGWTGVAVEYVRLYAMHHSAPFIAEELVAASREYGLIQPDNPKAFGPVFMKAAKLGIIRFVGWRNSPNRHCSPGRVWERA
jgi:hypothetical protein